MNHLSATFKNHRGEKLYYSYWEESSKSYNRIICLVHGFGMHSGCYPFLIPALIDKKCKVYGIDLRGFGLSPGTRGEFVDFEKCVDDLESFRRFIKQSEGYREIIFLGHSLGSAVVLAYPFRYPENRVRMILASLPMLSPLMEGKGDVALDFSEFSSENARVEMLTGDKLVVKKIRRRLLESVKKNMLEVRESKGGEFANRKCLFLHGESDSIAPLENVEKLYEELDCSKKKIVTFPRMKHDIFSERKRDRVFDAIGLWLSETEFEYKVS